MAQLALGIFTDRTDAENAIDDLEDAGYNPQDMSLIMKDGDMREDMAHTTGTNVSGGAAAGATTGAVIGGLAGLLIGAGTLAIPGLGAILIGGPLAAALGLTGAAATTLSGAATGAVAGGILGALMGLGIPKEEAQVYEHRINEGAILLAVPVGRGDELEAEDILSDNNASDIKQVSVPMDRMLTRHTERLSDEEYPDVPKHDDYPSSYAVGYKGGHATRRLRRRRRES